MNTLRGLACPSASFLPQTKTVYSGKNMKICLIPRNPVLFPPFSLNGWLKPAAVHFAREGPAPVPTALYGGSAAPVIPYRLSLKAGRNILALHSREPKV